MSSTGAETSDQKSPLLCNCGFPASVVVSGTERNPGRLFYGCQTYKTVANCNFFRWCDEHDGSSMHRNAWSDAMDEIRSKTKQIDELYATNRQLARLVYDARIESFRLQETINKLHGALRRRRNSE